MCECIQSEYRKIRTRKIWTLFMQRMFVLNKVSFHNNTVRFEYNSVSLHHYFIITQFGSNIIQLVSMFTKGKCRFESRAMKRAEKKQKVEAVTANTKSVGSFFKKSFLTATLWKIQWYPSYHHHQNLKRRWPTKHKRSVVMRGRNIS